MTLPLIGKILTSVLIVEEKSIKTKVNKLIPFSVHDYLYLKNECTISI